MRRGHPHVLLARRRPHDALQDLEKALPIPDTDDRIWTAWTLNLVGLCQIAVGRADLAAQAVREAEEIFTAEGQDVESVVTLHNRGWIAWCQGNVPVALRLYDEAADGYAALGEDYPLLVFDRCQALLAVGLASEAVDLAIRRIQSARSRRCTKRSRCSPWRTRSSPPGTTRLLSRTPRGHAGCSGPSVVPGGLSERSWRACSDNTAQATPRRRRVARQRRVARGLDEYGRGSGGRLVASRSVRPQHGFRGSGPPARPCCREPERLIRPRTRDGPRRRGPSRVRSWGRQNGARLVPTGAGIARRARGTLGGSNSGRWSPNRAMSSSTIALPTRRSRRTAAAPPVERALAGDGVDPTTGPSARRRRART